MTDEQSEIVYRDTLKDILYYSSGRRLLNRTDVMKYTGLNFAAVNEAFSFPVGGGRFIAAPVLARVLCTGQSEKQDMVTL